MTTPSISMVPLKRPVDHSPETAEKQLAVRLKKHMVFRPRAPKVESISVFTDPVKTKQLLSTGKIRRW